MIRGDAISHNVQFEDCTGALPVPVKASIAHLNVNGTDSVASLAASNSTTDQTTRILRSARSPGQMYGHRCTSVPIRVACSMDLSEEGSASPASGYESVWAINERLEQSGAPVRGRAYFCCLSAFCLSYRGFRCCVHPQRANLFSLAIHSQMDSATGRID